MSKVANYLQEHLLGEVTDSLSVRRHFTHDASILQLPPAIVVYPKNETDVRKAARFAWQLGERGRVLPITARGAGSDASGAAIGKGILMVLTAHMNKILTLDPRKQFVTVEPGITYDKLQQTLHTHGLFLPTYPSSSAYATLGGGLANNAIGEKSVKYGDSASHVEHLRIVLANGEIIETGKINKRELNRKLGLATLEGEVYRSIDALIEENFQLIADHRAAVKARHSASGYNLAAVKDKSSFDLTPLFLGSQGTLGIITEASLTLAPYTPHRHLALISLERLESLQELLPKILELKPSICDIINKSVIEQATRMNPSFLNGVLVRPDALAHLFIEFDDYKETGQKHAIKALKKLCGKMALDYQIAENQDEQDQLEKVRRAIAIITNHSHGTASPVPIADISVPLDRFTEALTKAATIFTSNNLPPALWGHAGSGVIYICPYMDLSQIGDRQKIFKVSDSVYKLAREVEGSISAGFGDGRLRAPQMAAAFGKEWYELMLKVKKIFDPYGILNPGVKTATAEDVKVMMRSDYRHNRHEHS